MSRSIARRASAISTRSRSGTMLLVAGWAVGAVGGGVDVVAAGQDQAVDQVEHLVGVLLEAWVGRDHQRQTAGALDRLDVAEGSSAALPIPDAPPGALELGADSDHGTVFAHCFERSTRLSEPGHAY